MYIMYMLQVRAKGDLDLSQTERENKDDQMISTMRKVKEKERERETACMHTCSRNQFGTPRCGLVGTGHNQLELRNQSGLVWDGTGNPGANYRTNPTVKADATTKRWASPALL